jgi:hypothetical protein
MCSIGERAGNTALEGGNDFQTCILIYFTIIKQLNENVV